MSLVLDPSLALSWYFEDERTAARRLGALMRPVGRNRHAHGLAREPRGFEVLLACNSEPVAACGCHADYNSSLSTTFGG